MKVSLLFLVTIFFLVGAGSAATASDSNVMGFYFDVTAETNCLESPSYATVPLHLILTSPSSDTLHGYEFGYTASGSYMISGTQLMGGGIIDVGGSQGNHIVGLGTPLSPGAATILATLSVFVMDENQIRFDLHGSIPASVTDYPELPALLYADDEIVAAALSTAEGLPNARINGQCNPETDENSWDGVKSLYH